MAKKLQAGLQPKRHPVVKAGDYVLIRGKYGFINGSRVERVAWVYPNGADGATYEQDLLLLEHGDKRVGASWVERVMTKEEVKAYRAFLAKQKQLTQEAAELFGGFVKLEDRLR
jgi:hypothetical protein